MTGSPRDAKMMDGWMDGQMDGETDGRMNEFHSHSLAHSLKEKDTNSMKGRQKTGVLVYNFSFEVLMFVIRLEL